MDYGARMDLCKDIDLYIFIFIFIDPGGFCVRIKRRRILWHDFDFVTGVQN